MSEVREVFEMVTKHTEPDLESWREQERRQRRRTQTRKVGAFVLVASLIVAAGSVYAVTRDRGEPSGIAGRTTSTPVPPLAAQEHFFLDLRTGETTPLPESIAGGWFYAVSPDGSMFAISPCCDPPVAVSVANVDGTDVRQMSPSGIDAFAGRWSPDGSRLVYQGRDGSTDDFGNLFVVDLDTFVEDLNTGITQVTDLEPRSYGLWFMSPSFSPDGQSILFHRWRPGPTWDLWSVPATGGEPTRVRRDASFGDYAPDGTIAYLHQPRSFTAGSIWLADADGGRPRQLLEGGPRGIALPRWSPDGTKIVYVTGADSAASEGDEIHVVDVATGAVTKVADGYVAEWFDDDTLVVGGGTS
jgi:Tol biopolymer transport system component